MDVYIGGVTQQRRSNLQDGIEDQEQRGASAPDLFDRRAPRGAGLA